MQTSNAFFLKHSLKLNVMKTGNAPILRFNYLLKTGYTYNK